MGHALTWSPRNCRNGSGLHFKRAHPDALRLPVEGDRVIPTLFGGSYSAVYGSQFHACCILLRAGMWAWRSMKAP